MQGIGTVEFICRHRKAFLRAVVGLSASCNIYRAHLMCITWKWRSASDSLSNYGRLGTAVAAVRAWKSVDERRTSCQVYAQVGRHNENSCIEGWERGACNSRRRRPRFGIATKDRSQRNPRSRLLMQVPSTARRRLTAGVLAASGLYHYMVNRALGWNIDFGRPSCATYRVAEGLQNRSYGPVAASQAHGDRRAARCSPRRTAADWGD